MPPLFLVSDVKPAKYRKDTRRRVALADESIYAGLRRPVICFRAPAQGYNQQLGVLKAESSQQITALLSWQFPVQQHQIRMQSVDLGQQACCLCGLSNYLYLRFVFQQKPQGRANVYLIIS